MTNEEMATVLEVHAVWLAECVSEKELEIQQDSYRTDGAAAMAKENLAHLLIELEATKAGAAALRREPREAAVDAAVTALYRRFKEWSKREFSADDVTWCEVRADVLKIIRELHAQPEGV